MSRFQNKIVMGGSDRESSESEDEYISGQEMVNLKYAQQCMYNATMYNMMIQNMMPCVPMPYVPPFGYPVPYPPMINEFPVNHPMAAGTYYRKGGRQHRSGRNKTRSRLHIERDDDVKYKPRHKQHLVQRHQYYASSTESDNDEKYPDTRGKVAPACQPVRHESIADKYDTLRHSNPTSNTGRRRLQNNRPIADVTHGSDALHHCKSEVHIAAKLPSCKNGHDTNADSHKISRTNVRTESTCTQDHTTGPAQQEMHDAAHTTMPLNQHGKVLNPDSMGRQLECDNDLPRQSPSVVQSSQTKVLATSVGNQGRQETAITAQEQNTAANTSNLPLSFNPPYMVATHTPDDSSKAQNGSQLTQSAALIVSASFKADRVMCSPINLQRQSNTAMKIRLRSGEDGRAVVHPQTRLDGDGPVPV